jgi:hypothetical protein
MDKSKLHELKTLCSKMLRIIEAGLIQPDDLARNDQMPNPTPRQRVELAIVGLWQQLRKEDRFTATYVKDLLASNPRTDSYVRARSYSSFSAILSRWANHGFLKIVERGNGPKPTSYTIAPKS